MPGILIRREETQTHTQAGRPYEDGDGYGVMHRKPGNVRDRQQLPETGRGREASQFSHDFGLLDS